MANFLLIEEEAKDKCRHLEKREFLIGRGLRGFVKKRIFYGQADRLGGGGGIAPSALTVSKCENFDPIKRA